MNAPRKAAHPWIAFILATLGRRIGNSAEPIVEHWSFIVIGLVAAFCLLYATELGLV